MTLEKFEKLEKDFQFIPFSDPDDSYMPCGWFGYTCNSCVLNDERLRRETDGESSRN